MITALVVLAGLSLVSLWTVCGVFVWTVRGIETRTRHDLAAAAAALVTPPAEGEPSALVVYSDQVATLFAARVIQQLKAAAGGIASGVSKDVQAEAMGQLAGTNPWIAVLAGLLPKRFRNSLLSSPQFTGQLSMLAGGGDHQAQPSASVADRLKRQT